jgi:hypothetical protein
MELHRMGIGKSGGIPGSLEIRATDGADSPNHWVNIDPTLAFADPSLGDLLAYWHRKRGSRRMPARADIDPLELKRHLGSLCLIDVFHAPLRMRYRLIGTKIVETMGRDSTGKFYDELYSRPLLADIERSFEWIATNRAPLRSFGDAFYADRLFYAYEIVNLPLSDDGETVNMVLGKLVFRPRGAR